MQAEAQEAIPMNTMREPHTVTMAPPARWAILALCCAALGACNKGRERQNDQEDKSGVTTLTGESMMGNEAAIDRVVASRCARELACNNVGPDRHFTTSDACVTEVRKQTKESMATSDCPSGVDGEALDKCLDSIRSEACNSPINTLSRFAACRAANICVKATPAPMAP